MTSCDACDFVYHVRVCTCVRCAPVRVPFVRVRTVAFLLDLWLQVATKPDNAADANGPRSSSRSQSPQTPFDSAALDSVVVLRADNGVIPPTAHADTAGQVTLPQDLKSQLEQQASVADERAAVQESQLHNTGRDMGDWLGVDHGVSLATRVSATIAVGGAHMAYGGGVEKTGSGYSLGLKGAR
jgi:hypothetical protein